MVPYYTYVGFHAAAADAVCASWMAYAPLLTVRIKSNSIAVAVIVPTSNTSHPNFLSRALALKTHKVYGSGSLDIVRHKQKSEDHGEYDNTFIAACNAERPAFIIKEKAHASLPDEMFHSQTKSMHMQKDLRFHPARVVSVGIATRRHPA